MIIWKKKLIKCCKCHKSYSFDDNLFYHLKEYILVCPNCNLMHKVDIQLLGKEYEGLKKVDKLNLTAIDIGSAAISRNNTGDAKTWIDKNNPSNATGKITSIEIYARDNTTGLKVGIFFLVSGQNYSTRDSVTIGDVLAGYHQYNVNLDVSEGDLIGLYQATGTVGYTTSSAVGLYSAAGDFIPCTNQSFIALNTRSYLSLYGTGATAGGWPHKWNGATIAKLNGAVITKWNGVA